MRGGLPIRREGADLEQRVATSGRVAVWFIVRYLTPLLVLLAVAVSDERPNTDRLAALLTAQVAFAVATHALATRGGSALELAVWIGMTSDIVAISALVALTGGTGGALVFLYTVHALAAGILLSSRAGVRMLAMSTLAIVALDVLTSRAASVPQVGLPGGVQAAAALWILGGGATLFSIYNERELRRRNAELATIRQVTLDIEQTLSLEEIFADLCRGVMRGFGFDAAALLLRDGDRMRCVGAHGEAGPIGEEIELRGRVAHALALSAPSVTTTTQAGADASLVPVIGKHGYLAVPIAEDGLLVVTRKGRKGRPGTLRAHEIEALDRLAHHARLAIANARLHARVSEMAITDPLTGLMNHGEMQRRLASEVGRLQRYATLRGPEHHLSFLLLDIDQFKRFNDRYGHPAGDAVLKGVSAAVRGAVRTYDIVARYGGEELAVILPETDAPGAREVAERIRKAVAAYPFATRDGQKPVRVTVSVGAATGPVNGATAARLVSAADAALYGAKEAGRNRTRHADETPDPMAKVIPMRSRRPRAPAERPARDGSRRARGRSSLPKRRTPRA